MAIAFYNEFPDMSTAQSESILHDLKLNGRSPTGQIMHAEGPLPNGGTWVFDMWESEQALFAFVEKDLVPLMTKAGIKPPQPTLRPARVYLTAQEMRKL